ncbi:hypothetical protein DICPUDRAFT_54298 [Dictyostelium purpureum]|uniref:Uncharacterized protein n=1 Tax=Dictyostelium purpureum TaxID=5786 RepID=F0ZGG5_DICPU|nr:uncharacterized protein DICPUDRAFT_54298 [Dictyostelium purpureum]EGC36938.1 hypothetical protein DICPUDRAFT_54298 [Dictyostelium purpureum]|eukprot:XP_003286506.1 hypothetical protein DICPUDRAFT_54298 [Dictyostelium purpureum]
MFQNQNNISLQDGYEFIIKHVSGALHFKLINTLLRLGICDILDDGVPRTHQELASIVNIPEEGMFKILRYFTFHKLFTENEVDGITTFSKSNYSEFFTKGHKLFGVANMFSSDLYYDLFKSTPDSFFGNSSGVPNSMNVAHTWDLLDSESNKVYFKNAMNSATEAICEEIINKVDFSQSKVIVDVGGSHGQLISSILEKYPSIEKGINFDLEKVIVTNKKPTDPRLEHVSGSFFESVPAGDSYILRQIIHDWSDEDSVKIINTISNSMKPGGKLYIFDYVIDNNNYQHDSLYFDMKMYHFFHGQERTESQFRKLLDQCGFKIDFIFRIGLVASKK